MTWFTGIIAYILIWWTALFAILPLGLVRDEAGHPENPRLLSKVLVTTGISAIIWLILLLLIRADVIDFRQMSAMMMQEDRLK